MAWQTIDFHGIVSLDRSLIDQLQRYLEEKETHLSQEIGNAIELRPEFQTPILPSSSGIQHKISEGVEIFTRKANLAASNPKVIFSPYDWQTAASKVNRAIWEYLEVLEGCVIELFQQLDQVGFEKWKSELINVVESIKDILSHSLEDLKWACKRLENQLWDYRWTCEWRGKVYQLFWKTAFFWKTILDRSIFSNLEKSQKFLNFRYQNFVNRYKQFEELNGKIEKSLVKFLGYGVLNSLDVEDQGRFKRLYHLLKLWEQNKQTKSLPQREPIRVLRNAISVEQANTAFKDYYQALRKKLFDHSRYIKKPEELAADPLKDIELRGALSVERLELHTLGATISKYRDFLLRTDPNPYVRARWGFGEWIVGPEPATAKQLLHSEYDIESLDSLYLNFNESLQKYPEKEFSSNLQLQQDVQRTLHDMGQPLASSSMTRVRVERFIYQLQQLDELGCRDSNVIDFMTQMLSKGMRADWKYHILHEFPLFHQLYSIHLGIVGPLDDRQHINRVNKFKRLLQQLHNWIKEKHTLKHIHEIEIDMSDIKGYLQDFLAHVQRVSKDANVFTQATSESVIRGLSLQLLEYRYMFGHFFHQLRENESEEKLIRNQFLFVDQYFESVENKLAEMRNTSWSEEPA